MTTSGVNIDNKVDIRPTLSFQWLTVIVSLHRAIIDLDKSLFPISHQGISQTYSDL